MTPFMDEDFLLKTPTARRLYHQYAKAMPIIDYHCHINPQEIYEDTRYGNITQVWLGGDHYKWRAMRWCGVPESDITGSIKSDPYRVFQAWARTLPNLIGNPLYHWTYLELKRYFGIDTPLNGETARSIYDRCNERLAQPEMSVRGIIRASNVRLLCTTDDPADPLEWHRKIREDPTCPVRVLPAFRPDKAVHIEAEGFAQYLDTLAQVSGEATDTFPGICRALDKRIGFFDGMGCRAADHALVSCVYEPATEAQLNETVRKARSGEGLTQRETDAYQSAVLLSLARKYRSLSWVMQLHFGCIRNLNSAMYETLGPDTGFDAVSPARGTDGLARLLDKMRAQDALPRMVLYSLDANDNTAIATIAGCFNADGACPGQIQLGSAWWFNDTKAGMEKQLTDLAGVGALGGFIGMLTDSRSFLSYTRHEYFRRILCSYIGMLVENGEYHDDEETLGRMVQDISYHNTARFFGFDKLPGMEVQE